MGWRRLARVVMDIVGKRVVMLFGRGEMHRGRVHDGLAISMDVEGFVIVLFVVVVVVVVFVVFVVREVSWRDLA